MYFKVADELTQSELVLGVGSGVGLCITVLLVVGLWVRHAKCGQRSEVIIIIEKMVIKVFFFEALDGVFGIWGRVMLLSAFGFDHLQTEINCCPLTASLQAVLYTIL